MERNRVRRKCVDCEQVEAATTHLTQVDPRIAQDDPRLSGAITQISELALLRQIQHRLVDFEQSPGLAWASKPGERTGTQTNHAQSRRSGIEARSIGETDRDSGSWPVVG